MHSADEDGLSKVRKNSRTKTTLDASNIPTIDGRGNKEKKALRIKTPKRLSVGAVMPQFATVMSDAGAVMPQFATVIRRADKEESVKMGLTDLDLAHGVR
jgi:hypothetical protein